MEPLNQILHMDLGWHYRRHGSYPQALAAFQEVVYLNSEHPEARLAQSAIMDLQGDMEASAVAIEEVLQQQGRTAQYFYYQSLHLSAAGDHRIAIQTATSGISSYPDESRLYQVRGAAFSLLGMTGKAKVDYYDALALDGNNLKALRLLGSLSEQERHIDVAIRAYGQVLEHEPGDETASLGLARSLLKDLQLPAAIEELTTRAALHGPSAEANLLLAQGYYLSSLRASQNRDFHRALEFQAASSKRAQKHSAGWTVTALLWAGEAEWSHGREQYAATYYQLAVDMNPFSAKAHIGLSLAYDALGESAKAGWHVQEAERLGWLPRRQNVRFSNSLP
ncbi:MAG: tetratricopeptide repeat protein [Candidatus Marinimicrobia bacterium]|nr:tetratricopeptide repeat protein [Candidatus Neomarinimicrobiota bacterium]